MLLRYAGVSPDVVVGDADGGVVVVAAHSANEIAAEAAEMTVFEDFA